jgi:hypothetical protein
MPGPNDALVKLLMEKYGLPLDQADALAYKMLADKGNNSFGIPQEAITNVANREMDRMADLSQFPHITAAGRLPAHVSPNSPFAQRYEQFVQGGKDLVSRRGAEAAAEREYSNKMGMAAEDLDRAIALSIAPESFASGGQGQGPAVSNVQRNPITGLAPTSAELNPNTRRAPRLGTQGFAPGRGVAGISQTGPETLGAGPTAAELDRMEEPTGPYTARLRRVEKLRMLALQGATSKE